MSNWFCFKLSVYKPTNTRDVGIADHKKAGNQGRDDSIACFY